MNPVANEPQPFRTTTSPAMPAVRRSEAPEDAAEQETSRRRAAGAVAFDNLVSANLAFVEMGRKVLIANMLVLGAVLLQSAISIYAMVR